jgi:hypothetical protein
MTDEELRAYCEALVDGGIFDGVPGLTSPDHVDDDVTGQAT